MRPSHADAEAHAPVHGGDLLGVARKYGIDPGSLLDFSANCNPAGPPRALLRALESGVRDIEALGRYPESDARSLRLVLGAHLDIEPDAIVVANGASAVFGPILTALRTQRCVVPVPAFSEYRHAVRAAGAQWCSFPLDARTDFALDTSAASAAVRLHEADTCLVTNPHNPSGSSVSPGSLLQLAADVRSNDVVTIVDEAFIDYAPALSITRAAATTPHLIAVRSLTKFFGVPALRVGYAVAQPDTARRIRTQLASWPVTTLAMHAIGAALGDSEYATRTLAENSAARTILARELTNLGLRVAASAANFLLITLPPHAGSATDVARRLVIRERIVVRDCSSYAGLANGAYIRVAVRGRTDNGRLVRALSRILKAQPAPCSGNVE